MLIDHIFIFTETPSAAAEELRAFGLTEASSRVHVGQGTANRKFHFANFFLELLWVQNAAELNSPTTRPSGLWQRADHREHGASPYGLCLVNTPATDDIFAAATLYQSAYFPAGHPIAVLAHGHNLSLPWTFRFPCKGPHTANSEPISHPNGVQLLPRAVFGLAHFDADDEFVRSVAGHPQLQFVPATENHLCLTFDRHRQGKTRLFDGLALVIQY